jgi:Domain of unknown function (DUF4082)
VTVALYGGITAGWSSASTSAPYQLGNPWRQTEDSVVSALGFFRGDTGSGVKATALSLFRRSDQALLAFVSSPTDSGSIGWQWSTLSTPVPVTNGTEYVVCAYYPAGNVWFRVFSSSKPTPPANTAWLSFPREDEANIANNAYPATAETGSVYNAVDVQLGDPSSSAGGPNATVGDLASWLSTNTLTNQHQTDGLPWQTKVDTADTRTKVTNGLNLAGGLQGLSDSLAHAIQMASDWFASGSTTIFTDLKSRVLGTSGGGGSAFYGPSGTQVAEGVETLLAQCVTATELGAQLAVLRERVTLSPDLTDTSRWTLVDTVSGAGDALVELQADLFRITIGDAPGTHGPLLVASGEWRPRWGWCAPRVHGCYLQRQPLVDLSPIGVAPGLFMDGLLIYAHPGFTWSVEAFVLDRS